MSMLRVHELRAPELILLNFTNVSCTDPTIRGSWIEVIKVACKRLYPAILDQHYIKQGQARTDYPRHFFNTSLDRGRVLKIREVEFFP